MEPGEPTRVSIGILAWNEAACIEDAIASLAGQRLFFPENTARFQIDVTCVANGCEDDTAGVASASFGKHFSGEAEALVATRVEEVPTPGKSNAWNCFVHEFAPQDADYLILMDADILFGEPDTLTSMLEALEQTPSARVAVDLPVKDVASKENKGLIDRLSLRMSRENAEGPIHICGQLYCGRGPVLRSIWMPVGLTLEDGFLSSMVRTANYTEEKDYGRIVRVPGATHVFEAYTAPMDILRHHRAVSIGSAINVMLGDYLAENTGEEDGGEIIRLRTEEEPDWFSDMVRDVFASRGYWAIPDAINFRRFRRLKGMPISRMLAGFPMALAGFLVESTVNVTANHHVKRTKSAYFWEKTRSD
jgi:hypothetical protein